MLWYSNSVTDIKPIADFWPIIVSSVLVIVWLVRLEGRINEVSRDGARNEKRTTNLENGLKQFNTQIVEQLSEVKQSLARLEGALGVRIEK